ncbi:MAG: hypothetical protein HN742_38355 [Lentisphaerae bacterium]|jgi:hypothetical protein|nr:hypothetical protein [Lentisphaerota bacterium]MBT5609299.1 hypothetical protein [Lentisphaerota bacterium]MBT7059407.1 hypothetical protein [Lentisphaerota bacterium]MBT7847791.1 hypothetical protein [Lentisphaerota bacterium]
MTSTTTWKIAAAVCVAACVGLFRWGYVNQKRAGALREQLATMREHAELAEQTATTTVPTVPRDQYDAVQNRLTTLNAEKERLEKEVMQLAQTISKNTTTEPKLEPEPEPREKKTGPGGMLAKMFSGKQGKKMAEMSARAALDMQYGDFFRETKLPADVEQKIRDLIVASLVTQIEQSLGRAGDGAEANAPLQTEKERAAQLRAELAELLTPDELATWDEYEETKTERMLLQQYDMQLGMYAPSLSEDKRKRASEVLVGELMATTKANALQTTGNPKDNFEQGMKAQFDTLDRAREKLAAELNEEQLSDFDKFIEQQKRHMRMAATMMGGLAEEAETKEE